MIYPSTLSKTKGFSLAETMMQLMLLTAVTIPMVMALNIQKYNITQDQQVTTYKVQAEQLFDHVVVQDPNPIADYTVSINPAGNYYSITCDPAINSYCTEIEQATGPYFTRTVTYLPDINANGSYGNPDEATGGLLVTVNLYNTSSVQVNGKPQAAYYTATQTYQLDTYRVQVGMGQVGNALTVIPNVDGSGNSWFPDTWVNAANGIWYNNNAKGGTWSASTCASKGTTALDYPFANYCTISGNSPYTYIFNVIPNKTYDVNLYFVLPQTAVTLNCLSGISNASCVLADITEESWASSSNPLLANNPLTTKTYSNFDLNAATGFSVTPVVGAPPNTLGYVFHSTVQIPPINTNVNPVTTPANLSIVIQPSASCAKTCSTYLSGIEVLRRDTQ